MKTNYLLLVLFLTLSTAYSQESKYDENLVKSLNADEYGMKHYIFCILKSGTTTASDKERAEYFKGHMANIKRLADEGKLIVAGPLGKNDKNYRGIFIFNVTTVEEAKALVETDPAVKASMFECEFIPWYSSAALMQVNEIHKTIAKKKL